MGVVSELFAQLAVLAWREELDLSVTVEFWHRGNFALVLVGEITVWVEQNLVGKSIIQVSVTDVSRRICFCLERLL